MMRFSSVRLERDSERDYVRVDGPVMGDLAEVRHIHFGLAQPGVLAEGVGELNADTESWTGRADVGGLQAGPAVAFGAATIRSAGWPAIQTFTWFENVDITE
jgi:hypothetical protein